MRGTEPYCTLHEYVMIVTPYFNGKTIIVQVDRVSAHPVLRLWPTRIVQHPWGGRRLINVTIIRSKSAGNKIENATALLPGQFLLCSDVSSSAAGCATAPSLVNSRNLLIVVLLSSKVVKFVGNRGLFRPRVKTCDHFWCTDPIILV